jgi:hypothetical protein
LVATPGCRFEFTHERRPRERCGQPTAPGRSLCIWHDARARPPWLAEKLVALVEAGAWLEGAELEGLDLAGADLRKAKLPRANLRDADLRGAALDGACLDESALGPSAVKASFHRASLRNAALVHLDARRADLTRADLSGANLDGARLGEACLCGAKVTTDTNLYDVSWEPYPGETRDLQFRDAAQVYRALELHFRAIADYEQASRFYFSQMEALHLDAIDPRRAPGRGRWERVSWWLVPRSVRPARLARWLSWGLHRATWGYGARPFRTLWWMVAAVCLFALVYLAIGVVTGAGTRHGFPDALSVSVVTFATLGYGTRTPHGVWGETLGGVEALLGVVLPSMFIVALATKYVHRG